MSKTKTYVYDGEEVSLTGRKAKKEIQIKNSRVPRRVDVLVEIEPASNSDDLRKWKKWVRIHELYEIIDPTEE